MKDEELIVKFYGCDDKAFETLWWCRWYQKLRGFVAREVDNKDVEDVLQETALKLCKTKHHPSSRYDPQKGEFDSWVWQIARNEVTNYFRRQKGSEIPFGELVGVEGDDEGETPEPPESLLNQDEANLNWRLDVWDAVSRLSEPSRTIVQRYFWDDLTIKEIAEELGMSVPTVHRRLNHDLERLKEMLGR